MSSTADRYGIRRNGAAHGDVFTSPRVVSFMLDLAGYTSDKDLSEYTLLEPSVGKGNFLSEIQARISESATHYGFDAEEVMNSNIYGCELDADKLTECVGRLKAVMPGLTADNFINTDFLTFEPKREFDFIVGNPPYVRYENIPEDMRNKYRGMFRTFHYRSDLYVLFYEHSLKMLKKDGVHCFICPDRWLKNEYGKKLRQFVESGYDFEYLVEINGAEAFGESVLAYPAITVIANRECSHKVKVSKISSIGKHSINFDTIETSYPGADKFDSLFLNMDLSCLAGIEEMGFSIGIGVATGADRVFISRDIKNKVENELLLPIINARDLRGDRFTWGGRYLLNPYGCDGRLVDLEMYPKAKLYLENNRNKLESRHIVKNNRKWYSLIDKVKLDLMSRPKILLPDMSGNKVIFVDQGQFYPSHNLYYITGRSSSDLEILATLLMSSFVRMQISKVSSNMNGGFPRWQSQSIRKLRLPVIDAIPCDVALRLRKAYVTRDFEEIDRITDYLIKLPQCRKKKVNDLWIQPSLFSQQERL